ncbi:hypothetical protein RJT34_20306 [Clitoria ternatea]|uniref:DNA-directed RNA polymerase n=1 Tax=Clitoria ternatea TaxID=43366 RepID=A0AAN9ISP2_CLITE
MEVLMAERANLVFQNKVIGGTAIKQLISRLIDHFGMAYTSHILDQYTTSGVISSRSLMAESFVQIAAAWLFPSGKSDVVLLGFSIMKACLIE